MSNNLIGQTLAGRYRVEDAIGRGGMAEVYKVFDTHRAVHLAMKVLREEIAQDRVFIRRFKREAQTLAALQHPNIVRLYGLEQDDLLVFMLMDFVEGTNLRAEILRAQGPLAPERVLEVMRPVCSALHYAHKQGVIHCDIKPGNIMIDKRGTVLVADFGIARAAEGATVTMVGVGTPAYMAPELVTGQAPSPQADIYALGIVLYEMLTGGERPFTGEAAKTGGTTAEKVRWEQVNLKPPSPRKLNRDLSPEVEAVVLRCLAKEPEQRYPGPLDLLNALEQAMGEAEIAAPPRAVEAGPAPEDEALAIDSVKPKPAGSPVISSAQPVRREEPLIAQPVAPTVSEEPDAVPLPAAKPAFAAGKFQVSDTGIALPARARTVAKGRQFLLGGIGIGVIGLGAIACAVIIIGLLALSGVLGGGAAVPEPTRPSASPTQAPMLTDNGFNTASIDNAKLSSDKEGAQETTVFSSADTFYCIVTLANAPDDTKVKAVWTAVDVEGEDPNTSIDEAETTTDGNNVVTFNLTIDTGWPSGKYKVDLYLNGTLARTLEFEVADVAIPGIEYRQWAISATATSQYGNPDWSAMQATGVPNTTNCGDFPTAWASGYKSEVAALTLTYVVPVVPSRIEIYQTLTPGLIVKVEVVDEAGTSSIVYQAQATPIDQCPYVQIVPVTGLTAKVMMVIVTVDQSVITEWNEIDAVELIGIP